MVFHKISLEVQDHYGDSVVAKLDIDDDQHTYSRVFPKDHFHTLFDRCVQEMAFGLKSYLYEIGEIDNNERPSVEKE